MRRYFFMASGLEESRALSLALRRDLGLRPAVWMGDQRHENFAKSEFPDVFVLSNLDMIRRPFPDKAIREQAFFVLADYWTSDDFSSERHLILDEWNRHADFRFARKIDRETTLMGIQAQVMEAVLSGKPDFLLASETPHNVTRLPAFFLLRWLGIPLLFFQPTSPISPALVPRTSLDSFLFQPLDSPTPQEFPEIAQASEIVLSTAKNFLKRLERDGETVKQKEERSQSKTIESNEIANKKVGRRIARIFGFSKDAPKQIPAPPPEKLGKTEPPISGGLAVGVRDSAGRPEGQQICPFRFALPTREDYRTRRRVQFVSGRFNH